MTEYTFAVMGTTQETGIQVLPSIGPVPLPIQRSSYPELGAAVTRDGFGLTATGNFEHPLIVMIPACAMTPSAIGFSLFVNNFRSVSLPTWSGNQHGGENDLRYRSPWTHN